MNVNLNNKQERQEDRQLFKQVLTFWGDQSVTDSVLL